MKHRNMFPIMLLVLAMLACNFPSVTPTVAPTLAPPTETATSLPTQTPMTDLPTLALTATETPTPLPTATPTIPIAWPLDKGVNCRIGPSTNWLTIGALLPEQKAVISGKNADSSWWYVTTPNDPGRQCWVAASVTRTAGNLANVPVIDPPEASVLSVRVKLDPTQFNLPGCMGPLQQITVQGTIETNGPLKVKWYFASEQGGALPQQTTNFDAADTKTVEASISPIPASGSFWVQLIIVGPGGQKGEASYKINCS
jgi:hypothetical protein